MPHRPVSAPIMIRTRRALVCGVALTVAVGGLVSLPNRAVADYQTLPVTSPATWTYNATLLTLRDASDAASKDGNNAAASLAAADRAYATVQKSLADAQATENAAASAQTEAKAKLDSAQGTEAKAKAQAAYNKAVGARHAASDKVASVESEVRERYSATKSARAAATKASTAASFANTKLSRFQYMYGSAPTTAFTTPRATYTFSGNGRRPSSSQWKLYNTSLTSKPTARDPRYVGVYKNNLEVTSWGQIGSGACLCAGSALPTAPYGRWEVRAKVNRNADHGVAVLLWPNERLGPQSGEIDLAEFNQSRTQANFALHYDAANLQTQAHILGDYRSWHTYRVDWNSRGISWYIDNNLFAIVTDKAQIPTKPFHLVIQAGANSSKSEKTSTTVAVSSVKVYAP